MRYEKFVNPDTILRPAPFWAINDRIVPEETARQLTDMRRVGLSGGFFHSRHGLTTDYLGEEWFAAMRASIEAAKATDGYVWLYDEDLWPSGNAGGQVAGMRDEYRAAQLQAELLFPGETPTEVPESEPRAAYRIERDGLRLLSATAIPYDEAVTDTSSQRLVFRRVYTGKTPWWSGESYANLLHPEAMREFVTRTHEVYKEHLGEEFGKRIPGIFTDEPNIVNGPDALAWYEGLPALYAEWFGRDFWADLPALFFDAAESRVVRLYMHRLLVRQFCESFSKPIYEWCARNGLAHTGHYLEEDSLSSQIRVLGGSVMAHYRYQQIPGIDHLCRQTEPMLLTVKQAHSAARQLGRPRVLTEIFGVSRHTNTFADFKWIGDYNLVLGATFFCPHLTLYSARGRRKRDYPPNWNYQQTYWDDLNPLNDYFTRVGYALTSGTPQVDVLLLHPIESGTAGHRLGVKSSHTMPGEDMHAAWQYDREFRKALEATLNAGYECDLGDEWLIEDDGAVEGDTFRIGKMAYRVVLVPPSSTWRPRTLALLQQFVANGGTVVFLGGLPTEVDCQPTDAWQALAAQCRVVPSSRIQIQDMLDKVAPQPFTLRNVEGAPVPKTYVQHVADGKQHTFFIINSDREHSQRYIFTLPGGASTPLAVWNPLDGSRAVAPVQTVDGDLRYTFTLPPVGSVLLVAGPDAVVDAAPLNVLPELSTGAVTPLPATWAFARSEENVLVLDRISASPDGGQSWWPEDLEFRIRRQLAAHFDIKQTLEWQPWVAIRKGIGEGKGGEVVLRYRFTSALDQPKAYVVIEDLTRGSLTVNGRPIDSTGAGWHWDHGFGKVEITDLVHTGENIVDFRVHYDFLTEVEAAYVVGDFGVELATPSTGALIAEPLQLQNGSWVEQGYPFYSGRMTYRTTVEQPAAAGRTFLRLKQASGILYHVRVNGDDAGSILWQPHVLELTDHLRPGANTLEIEVVSSRQNTLGPLHEWNGDDNQWCGPNAFEDEYHISEPLALFDYGLLGGAELVRM